MTSGNEHDGRGHAGEEVRLLDLVAVVLRRWRLIGGVALATVALALAVAAARPRLYTARTVLLPPASQGGGGRADLLAAQLSGLPSLGSSANSTQRLVGAIARSRTLSDSVVARVAGPGANGDTVAIIRKMLTPRRMRVEPQPDGSVAVEVSGPDPRLAMRVANVYPPLINSFSARLTVQSAQRREQFLEGQLRRARERLERSENELVSFQRGRNAPEIQEQARRTVDAAAELQRAISEQEIRVAQLRRSATANNPALRAAEAELSSRRAQLRRVTAGAGGGGSLFVPLTESPGLKAASTRLVREFTKNEQIYLSLTGALAEAQIEANNDLPVVSVLDYAVLPTAPSGVGTKVIGALAAALGLALGLVLAFVAEHLSRARTDPASQSFFVAWDEFRDGPGRFIPGRRGGNGARRAAEAPANGRS